MKISSTLLGLTLVALAGAQTDNKPIAVVNGQSISGSSYFHRMEHLNGVYARYGERLVEVAPGLITLDRLITERVTIELAQNHNVSPSQAEVDKAYAARLASDPTMETDAAAEGLTVDDLKYQVTVDLARFKLLTEGVLVTDQEVQTNYDNHKERYAAIKLVDVRVIVVDSDADRAAVDADLAGGKDFASVATALSTDMTKVRGGLILGAVFDTLDQPIKDALNAVKVGQVTPWVSLPQQPDGSKPSEKILFVKAAMRPPIPLDDSLKEAIRRQIMMDRGSIKNDVGKEVEAMLATAKVEISDPVFAKAWEALRAKATGPSAPQKPAGSQ